MKQRGWLLALAGLVLATYLFVRDDPAAIARLLTNAGTGLVLAALCHVVPMILNARAWQILMEPRERLNLTLMIFAVWVRESVNALLPVARVGGELVSFRVLVSARLKPPLAAATLVVDMTLAVLSQALFALLGVVLLMRTGSDDGLAYKLGVGVLILLPLTAIFFIVQRGGLFAALARLCQRLFAGRLSTLVEHWHLADAEVKAMYARRRAIAACFMWQCAGWVTGALGIWVAAYFLGQRVSVLDALAIEAIIQAVSSAAFLIPGALGVQEGAFMLAGAALGLDAPAALALAASRRIRDIVIFFPGLAAWTVFERSRRFNRDVAR